MLEKLPSIDDFIPSMAVSIPTREVIPMAMIAAVRMVLRRLSLMDLKLSLMLIPKFTDGTIFEPKLIQNRSRCK